MPAIGFTTARSIAAARADLAALELRLKPIIRISGGAGARFVTRSQANANRSSRPIVSPPASAAEVERRARISDSRTTGTARRQVVSKEPRTKARGVPDGYQRRVDAVPARESELAELTRDYSNLQTLYQTLLAKQEESKIAANLERRRSGSVQAARSRAGVGAAVQSASMANRSGGHRRGTLRRLGPRRRARVPRPTFTTDDEFRAELALPVLAVVPLMESDDEQRHAPATARAGCRRGPRRRGLRSCCRLFAPDLRVR